MIIGPQPFSYFCIKLNLVTEQMTGKDNFFIGKEFHFNSGGHLNLRGSLLNLDIPKIMGILNLAPDSFYDGGRHTGDDHVVRQTEKMLNEGAAIIDIGSYSSRPGAIRISEELELKRLDRPLKIIRKRWPDIYISIDTFRSGVAKRMVIDYEADMINDISGGDMDPEMYRIIKELNVAYVFMHMRGTPEDMQENPVYANVLKDVLKSLASKLDRLTSMGITDVVADPGFGFGKTLDHNYILMANLDAFLMLGVPLMVGISRKSMIYNLLGGEAEGALNGSTVLHTLAVLKGAGILRVHDVKEAAEVIRIYKKLREVHGTDGNIN